MKTLLFGAHAESLRPLFERYPEFELTESGPELVVCYGGDGTLLNAELRWPGVPKVPIRNSRRGNRCIARPPEEVIASLVAKRMIRTEFLKIDTEVRYSFAG